MLYLPITKHVPLNLYLWMKKKLKRFGWFLTQKIDFERQISHFLSIVNFQPKTFLIFSLENFTTGIAILCSIQNKASLNSGLILVDFMENKLVAFSHLYSANISFLTETMLLKRCSSCHLGFLQAAAHLGSFFINMKCDLSRNSREQICS